MAIDVRETSTTHGETLADCEEQSVNSVEGENHNAHNDFAESAHSEPPVNAQSNEIFEAEVQFYDEQKLADKIEKLNSKFDGLERLFQSKIEHSEHERSIVDNMHRELQEHRNDMYSKLTGRVLADVIAMRNNIMKLLEACKSRPEGAKHITIDEFEVCAIEVKDILENHGVVISSSTPEIDDFSPGPQRATKKISTNIVQLNKKIAKSVSDGYSISGKTMYPEQVEVYIYEAEKGAKQ